MDIITLDTETYYDKQYSLSKLTTEEYIRDPRFEIIGVGIKFNKEPARWITVDPNLDEVSRRIKFAAELNAYNWSNAMVLMHNALFDGAILGWYFGIKPALWLDTLSMARPLHGSTIGVSLKALAEHYGIGVKGAEVLQALGKHAKDFTATELIQYGLYCVNDVELTYRLFGKLKDDCNARELRLIDAALRMFIEPVLELDGELLTRHLSSVQAKKAELLERVEAVAGKDALMSNVQLATVLKSLGVAPPMKNSPAAAKRGEVKMTYAFGKTDKGFTDLLDHDNPMVQAVVAARLGVKSTLEETRTERLIGLSERGPLPIPLSYYGAFVTGRLSGSDKLNFQNMPRKGTIRKAIRAPRGYKIIASDSSNIELRVNHTLAGQLDSVEAFKNKRDLYCEFASILYGRTVMKPHDGMTPEEQEWHGSARQMGKLAHLSLGYGCGWEQFQKICRLNKVYIDEDESRRIVKLWRKTYNKIPALWDQCEKVIGAIYRGESGLLAGLLWYDSTGITLPSGRKIRYTGLRQTGDGWEYLNRRVPVKLYGAKVVENICQALAADIICDQWLAIAKRGIRVVLQVHDELVMIAKTLDAEQVKSLATKAMSTSPVWWPEIPLAAEAGVSERYGDAK